MDFWQGFMILTGVHLLAAASPGPDFVLLSQHTLNHGRKAGLICSLGITLGLSIHIFYSVLGLAAVIASNVHLLMVIKILGAAYLLYIGIKGIRAKKTIHTQNQDHHSSKSNIKTMTAKKSLLMGFACNTLNPKAPVYFIALFTVVLSPNMPVSWLLLYGLWMMVLQFCWFGFLSMMLSTPTFAQKLKRISHWIDRVCGLAMIALGIKILRS